MTRPSLDAWQPQAPSAGFAERAAAAVIRDRALSRRRVARPWVLLAAAACVLVAGVAWGWTALPRTPHRDDPAPAPAERADPTPSAAPRLSEPSREEAPPPRPLVRPRPAASAHPPVAAPSASAPKVPLPQCNCNAFACDCGPE